MGHPSRIHDAEMLIKFAQYMLEHVPYDCDIDPIDAIIMLQNDQDELENLYERFLLGFKAFIHRR